jgi:KipI family sensor histidine kinase inhibitor
VPAEILPYGEQALLVQLDTLDDVLALHAELTSGGLAAALADVVPGASTLLLVATSTRTLREVRSLAEACLRSLPPEGSAGPARRGHRGAIPAEATVEIAVSYDGEDLDEVARLTGLTRAEVVSAHTGTEWTVGFAGFAPGFAYLVGGDPRLEVPRRSSPRPRVPQGSVGLAGRFSGVYPRASPGGWQLIGRTTAPLWDTARTPPALFVPGARVRFVATEAGA